jgi:hypothetical protein
MARPKIIPRRTSEPPSRAQRLRRFITFVPLSVLLLERLWIPFCGTISEYLDLETIGATKTIKALPPSSSSSKSMTPYPLERVTMSYRIVDSACPRGTTRVTNVGNVQESKRSTVRKIPKIPKIFHQQAKTRCVTPDVYRLHQMWYQALLSSEGGDNDGWAMYFHNDEAMTRLLGVEEFVHEFPHLHLILRNCVQDRETKSLLWRYLVLYIYGGIYADLESAPNRFNGDTLRNSDDAFFLLDNAVGQLSTRFMATSPRHPLFYYALQHALSSLMAAEDVSMGAEIATYALQRAFMDFQNDYDVSASTRQDTDANSRQTYIGTDNRTVTVVRTDSESSKNGTPYVTTTAFDMATIKRDHKKMGMAASKSKGQLDAHSCRTKILMDISSMPSA